MCAKISRRRFLQLSALSTGTAVLAACVPPSAPAPAAPAPAGGATQAAEPKPAVAAGAIKLRVLYYGGQGSLHYDEFSKRFSEASNGRITVELETAPGNEMVTKQETGLATGTLADLVRGDTSFWPYLAKRGAWLVIEDLVKDAKLDLSEWFNIDWFRRFTDGTLSGLGGESGINHILTFYNREWVKSAWGKEPTDDWTMDDYVEAMTACVAAKGGPGKGYWGSNVPVGGYHVHDGFIRNWGGRFISEDGKTEMFSDEKTQVGIQWIMDQLKQGNIPTRTDLATPEDKLFYAGKIAMLGGGPGYASALVGGSADAGIDMGVCLFAKGPSAFENPPRRAFIAFSNPLSIYVKSKYPKEAFDLMLAITSVEAHKWITLKVGRQPGARLSTWYDPDVVAKFPFFPKVADLMKTCKDIFPMPANLRFTEWATLGNQEIPPLVYGDMPYTQENVQAINDHIQEIIDLPMPTTLIPKQ